MSLSLCFNRTLAERYKSPSQKAKSLTEDWVNRQGYCPNCGAPNFVKLENNRPVADFLCAKCQEEFELKSNKHDFKTKVVDGAYDTMTKRLGSRNNPNLFLLNYDLQKLEVINLSVIPKHFFVPSIIEKRKPLAPTAERAGWIGCNILLQSIPQAGKIFLVKNKVIKLKNKVLAEWQKTLFLREEKDVKSKGWIIDVMNCIERLAKKEFTLDEVYNFEAILQAKHPGNKHIKDKIRQQLQFLRDKGYLEFIGRGRYRVI
ncbi:MAG: restriction endonuclease [Candidatus Omnitrophica bacterium CG11_big_fil_rev_8_21_14_0_20_42_13]|uniref:Restriction endonuclease n=1 Tax=Candidatus Ghiorseimicrobium undicola TaxID=1974746 RepID=A0A2H0LXS6_9BACT|nr:MAG: restriction endonuclease [Candidatus Omnitrophica bacterium CG11_big_fil_rev_8_21_14_0_20_42_13]